ncbi:hypothetical protein J6590_080084, partial [Homalodisca vitripennis]
AQLTHQLHNWLIMCAIDSSGAQLTHQIVLNIETDQELFKEQNGALGLLSGHYGEISVVLTPPLLKFILATYLAPRERVYGTSNLIWRLSLGGYATDPVGSVAPDSRPLCRPGRGPGGRVEGRSPTPPRGLLSESISSGDLPDNTYTATTAATAADATILQAGEIK